MLVKTPDREYRLGETPPPIGQHVVSWPWGNTPHLTQWSLDALHYPLGSIIMDIVDGHPVVAQIQTHDIYGAHPEWGSRPHKGTSVFVPTATNDAGKIVAVRDPPEGWGLSPMGAWREPMRGGRLVHDREVRREERRDLHHDPYVEAARYFAPIQNFSSPQQPAEPPNTQTPQPPQPDQDTTMDHRDWRGHFTRVPKLAVLAATTVGGLAIAGTPIGAAIGLLVGLVADKEVRGGGWLPDFHGDFGEIREGRFRHEEERRHHRGEERRRQLAQMNGEGTWKVKRYDSSTGQFFYVGMVNAGSEGAAMDQAVSQIFSATAAKPYSLPGFTNVYITNQGDVFRLGMES